MDKRVKRGLRAARPKYQDGGSLPFARVEPDDLARAEADPHRYERFAEPMVPVARGLGDLARAPFDTARDARQAGGYSQLDPKRVGSAALNTGLGTLMPAVGGVGGRGGAVLMSGAGPTDKGIRAYHGSPHDFDKFDMSKIGTGEGAQAYGHGLYFAESEGVARSYRDTLGGFSPRVDGMPIDENNPLHVAAREVALKGQDKALSNAAYFSKGKPGGFMEKVRQQIESGNLPKYDDGPQGRMYEVRIDADPNDFLDWDKPLSQQSEKVQGVASRYFNDLDSEEGGNLINRYAYLGTEIENELKTAGVPGIKYLDQGSRSISGQVQSAQSSLDYWKKVGDPDKIALAERVLKRAIDMDQSGSRNYVLFRDDIVNIVRKYGMAAAVSMYGADAVNDALQPMTGNDG